ncbi:MAG: heme o synthase [Acidobacteriota bacterium]|nr:heme o synthase [Acidobacteriota bacterium]
MTTAPATLNVAALGARRAGLLRDYAELTKIRVTTLVVITAWCGFYFGEHKAGLPVMSFKLLWALAGIGMVSAGTACMNEIIERRTDALMRRTSQRPLVTGSRSLLHATLLWAVLTLGGALLLAAKLNLLTSALTLGTAATYLLAYTPLKKISPLCTFIGAFPGAMPGLLGWTAARGRLEVEAFVLFAIVFFWQFPHFHAIALMYREDYAKAGIKMLPVVEANGVSTVRQILFYGAALLPTTLAPTLLGMAGLPYLIGAAALGLGMFYFCARIWRGWISADAVQGRALARTLLKVTVTYLPLLFALMMLNSAA